MKATEPVKATGYSAREGYGLHPVKGTGFTPYVDRTESLGL